MWVKFNSLAPIGGLRLAQRNRGDDYETYLKKALVVGYCPGGFDDVVENRYPDVLRSIFRQLADLQARASISLQFKNPMRR